MIEAAGHISEISKSVINCYIIKWMRWAVKTGQCYCGINVCVSVCCSFKSIRSLSGKPKIRLTSAGGLDLCAAPLQHSHGSSRSRAAELTGRSITSGKGGGGGLTTGRVSQVLIHRCYSVCPVLSCPVSFWTPQLTSLLSNIQQLLHWAKTVVPNLRDPTPQRVIT